MDREAHVAKLTDQIAEIEEDMAWTKIHHARSGQWHGSDEKWIDTTSSVILQNERLLTLLKEAVEVATDGDD